MASDFSETSPSELWLQACSCSPPPPSSGDYLKKTVRICPYTQPFKVSLPPSEGGTEDAV